MTNKVALFFDSFSSYRRLDFLDYKRKRRESKTDEEIAEREVIQTQVKKLRTEILPNCGFRCFRQAGLESDDLIAQATKQLDKGVKRAAVMITSDGDLYQCITQNTIHWYDPARNLYMDHGQFWAHKGIDPIDWCRVKCIAGCKTDNVPGVPNIGEKTAINYINGHLKQNRRMNAIQSEDGKRIAQFNEALVKLPRSETKEIDLSHPKYKADVFFDYCKKLGIESYLELRRRSWESFFKGTLSQGRQIARRPDEKRRK